MNGENGGESTEVSEYELSVIEQKIQTSINGEENPNNEQQANLDFETLISPMLKSGDKFCIHQIRLNETLDGVSIRYDISKDQIRKAN